MLQAMSAPLAEPAREGEHSDEDTNTKCKPVPSVLLILRK